MRQSERHWGMHVYAKIMPSDCCASLLILQTKTAGRYEQSKMPISTVMGNSGEKGGFSVFIQHIIQLLFFRKERLVYPRKMVFLTKVDWIVDHKLQPTNVASTERTKSLVLDRPDREWYPGEKRNLPLCQKDEKCERKTLRIPRSV